MTSLRRDYFQIPYDPFPNDIENNPVDGQFPSIGLRDAEHEADAGVLFTCLPHSIRDLLLTVSPFYHYNSGNYGGSPTDTPVATTENRNSTYAGGQTSFAANYKYNEAGFLGFYQGDNQLFGAIFNDGSGNLPITDPEHPNAQFLEAFYIDDKFKPFSWLTLPLECGPTWFSEGNFPPHRWCLRFPSRRLVRDSARRLRFPNCIDRILRRLLSGAAD